MRGFIVELFIYSYWQQYYTLLITKCCFYRNLSTADHRLFLQMHMLFVCQTFFRFVVFNKEVILTLTNDNA